MHSIVDNSNDVGSCRGCERLDAFIPSYSFTHSMGDSITEGTISAWQKNVGDSVNVDDVVVVIETDKVCSFLCE